MTQTLNIRQIFASCDTRKAQAEATIAKFTPEQVEEYRATNKNPCKSYKTKAAAEKATAQMAQLAANHFAILRNINAVPARYMVIYIPAWGRYVGAIDLSELMGRQSSTGGHLGICNAKGFFSY